MPIYAYRCASCGHAKDVLRKVSDPLLTDCPACGAAAFQKQLTAAGFQLKGSGWYVTDFRNGTAAAEKKNDAAGAPEPAAAKPDEAKPAAATEKSGDTPAGNAAPQSAAAPTGCAGPCACH